MSKEQDTTIWQVIKNLIDAENEVNREKASEKAKQNLSETFIAITRSKGVEQNRIKLLEAIESSNKNIKRELNEEHFRVFYYDNLAVSRSLVTVKENGKEDTIFRNIHIFEYQDTRWLCKMWQVTQLDKSLNEIVD